MAINLPRMPDVTIDEIIAHSFKDYHVKGFDYICLRRSPTETVKVYFFDGDVSKLPEVVNPHDHRYDFSTLCVAGAVENIWFMRTPPHRGEVFAKFEYRTPLNGGNGFTFAGTETLKPIIKSTADAGSVYHMHADEIHTIRLCENETVICLVQREDKVPLEECTTTWTRGEEPPNLEGMYSKFTPDQVLAKLDTLRARAPDIRLPRVI